MKRIIYAVLTLIAAANIFGCSTPVTEDELAAIHEDELFTGDKGYPVTHTIDFQNNKAVLK